jgi:hypothetical protein
MIGVAPSRLTADDADALSASIEVSHGPLTASYLGTGRGQRMAKDRGASRLWRLGTGTALLALIVLAAAGPRAGALDSGTFVDQKFGWTLQYPRGFQLGTFSTGGLFESDGVWVANFDAAVTGTCCPIPNISAFRRFPADGAAFMLWFGQRLPSRLPKADSALPLTPERLLPTQPYVGGAEPTPLFLSFAADGIYFATSVWFGPAASAADRRSVADILGSVRFPHLRAGGWSR